jgi:DNA-binding transcriptional LysR family regulator
MTQSAVSQQLKAFEEELNTQLFNREVRPLRLTAAGKVLQSHGYTITNEINKTIASLNNESQSRIPCLNIGIASSFADTCLPSLLKALYKHADKVTLRTHDLRPGLLDHS